MEGIRSRPHTQGVGFMATSLDGSTEIMSQSNIEIRPSLGAIRGRAFFVCPVDCPRTVRGQSSGRVLGTIRGLSTGKHKRNHNHKRNHKLKGKIEKENIKRKRC